MQHDERYVYLDYAASAPERPEALAAEREYDSLPCAGANPNSLHTLGRQAAQLLDGTRKVISQAIGGGFRPSEMAFTSGGTESNNLAVFGMAEGARMHDRARTKVVLSGIEHDSVLDLVGPLRDRGFDVVCAQPTRDGIVSADEVSRLADRSTALVSVMQANNETGVIQPTADIGMACHSCGALFHVDAVQGFARIPLEVDSADAVSIAAHKIGGPVGIGVLAMRGRCTFRPQTFGGGQELGRRPGTQDVRGALAFAAAVKASTSDLPHVRAVVQDRANHVYERLCAEGTGIHPTTSACVNDTRLPGMVSVYVPGADSETLIVRLDEVGFEVSAGSACSSGSLDPSHVLTAMGMPRDDAFGSLRISFDERVQPEDLDSFCDALIGIVRSLCRKGHSR